MNPLAMFTTTPNRTCAERTRERRRSIKMGWSKNREIHLTTRENISNYCILFGVATANCLFSIYAYQIYSIRNRVEVIKLQPNVNKHNRSELCTVFHRCVLFIRGRINSLRYIGCMSISRNNNGNEAKKKTQHKRIALNEWTEKKWAAYSITITLNTTPKQFKANYY